MMDVASIRFIFLSALCLFWGLSSATAAEVELPNCMTAQVDLQALNELNKQALQIFPYVLKAAKSEAAIQVDSETLVKKYFELRGKSESESKLKALQDNIRMFILSGGVMIKGPNRSFDSGFSYCDLTKSIPSLVKALQEIPDFSPMLGLAIGLINLESAKEHYSRIMGRTAETIYFLVFGYNSWARKNRKEYYEYRMADTCMITRLGFGQLSSAELEKKESSDRLMDYAALEVNPDKKACEDLLGEKRMRDYLLFVSSSILISLAAQDYVTPEKPNDLAFTLNANYLREMKELLQKVQEKGILGDTGFNIMVKNYDLVIYYLRQSLEKK